MIKENKDKQREKNGNSANVKTDIPSSLISQSSESLIKEESNADVSLSEGDEGDSNSKKTVSRVSGTTPPVHSNICSLGEHNNTIGSSGNSNVQTVSNRASSSQSSTDLCIPDSVTEGIKTEEGLHTENSSNAKTEINGNTKHEFPNSVGTAPSGDHCDSVLAHGVHLPTTTGPPPNGVQPLPSNVINKQPGTMEAQYMQQQSQIFVFSTNLANKSAEAVLQGHFPSIIAYHCAQPGTKKYLEKHPLKMNQFNRQNPAQWLNSLAQMKQKIGPGIAKGLPGNFPSSNISGEIVTNPGTGSGINVWNQANNGVSSNPTSTSTNSISNSSNTCNNTVLCNTNPTTRGNPLMQTCSSNVIPGCTSSQTGAMKTAGIDSLCLMSASPNTNSILPTLTAHSPNVSASNTPLLSGAPEMAGSPVMNHSNVGQPSLTGVKVPDENLTPQQRQHREEQLATLRKMQQMLFPEHQSAIPEGANLPHTPEGMVLPGLGSVLSLPSAPGSNSPSATGSLSGPTPGTSSSTPVTGPSMGPAAGTSPASGPVSGTGQGTSPGSGSGHALGPAPGPNPAPGAGPGPGLGYGSGTGLNSGSASVSVPSLGGNGSGSNGSLLGSKNIISGICSNSLTPTSAAAQIEWQKLQHQFYEERKKKSSTGTGIDSPVGPSTPSSSVLGCTGNRTPVLSTSNQCSSGVPNSQGSRTQGPPPPYHQTARSASVPSAMSSSNPNSPNNPTSNLSLPSPRTTSGLNSPSDSNRSQFTIGGGNSNSSSRLISSGPSPTGIHNSSSDSPTGSRPLQHSNPSTPISTHLSPSSTRKDSLQNGGEFPLITSSSANQSTNTAVSNHQPSVENMFCRTLQSFAQQKQQLNNNPPKEPNLMPVPSPQQIQYLNAFEGQELTIQKQPNTSLKETNIQSPSVTPSANDGPSSVTDLNNSRLSGPATPLTPSSVELCSRCPPSNSDVNRFPVPSPHTPGSDRSQSQNQASQSSQSISSQQQQSQTSTQQTSQQSSQQQPLTPQQRDRFPGPSPQSQGPRTPGIETAIKTPTTEVNTRFLSSSPQLNENLSQNRFSNSNTSVSGTSPVITNQNQSFLQQTPPSLSNMKVSSQFLEISPSSTTSTVVDVSPTSSGNFSCIHADNVPLNPNSNGGVPSSGKIAHFDPITSMAQMSQQLTSSVANSPGSQAPTLMSGVPSGSCSSGMLPFNTSTIHNLQMSDIGNCAGLSDVQSSGSIVNSLGGNSNGSGNFVNIQMQNMPHHSYSPNSSVTNMVQCSGTVSTTTCMNQPIAHPNASSSPKPGNLIMGMVGPPRGSSPYSSSPGPQRMMVRPPGPSPYNGANVQVKPSAPNTIQYLPAKSQPGNSGPRGPLSLDFLQRFANPLSNLDSKVPTHNLQYFPNNLASPGNVSGLNVSLNRPNGLMGSMNSQIGISGSNCAIGGHVGNSMNTLTGPMMSPNSPVVGMNLPMTGSLVMGSGGPGVVPLRGGIRPGGIMRMQQMGNGMFNVAGNTGQHVSGDQIYGRGSPQNIGGAPNSQVFVPGSKSSPLGLANTPDASQPLPPSMGQSNNFKNPPFIATSDPNYAQQFHNFQQQLYATNTRSQMNNQGVGPNQSFFVPK